MLKAGCDGYLALEGTNTWEYFNKDAKSVGYFRQIMAEIKESKAIL